MYSWIQDTRIFTDRYHAGKELVKPLLKYAKDNLVIIALPRGGVEIGYEIAKALQASLDVIVSRKIGLPLNKEFRIGAISEESLQILDKQIINLIGIPQHMVEKLITEEQAELIDVFICSEIINR